MDPQRQRIEEDLRGLISGEIRCDDIFLQMYSSDASIYQIKPLGVVRPRSTADIQACVQYAQENQIPIHARGAGTGLAGESLGPGLVVDFSKHFQRIIHTDELTVRLQPGVVLERLDAHLQRIGRVFGPDPAMSHVTTMGSVVAIDASGSHWLKYGSARRHVLSLQIVLADGTAMEVGREPLVDGQSTAPEGRKRDLTNQLVDLLARKADVIHKFQPKSLVNRSGYHLADVLTNGYLDLPRLICGSEGTLALITEMTLATQPLPKHRGTALLLFDRLESAARAVQEILALGPSACDLMDRRHLSLARESDPRYDALIPQTTEAALLVEHDGNDPTEVRDRLRVLVDRIRRKKRLAFDSRLAFDAEDLNLFWELARKVVPTLYRLKGSTRALPFVEDIAVPPEKLSAFLLEMQNILKRHQVTATLYGHAGHGQLHVRPFMDLADPQQVKTMEALAGELYQATFDVGGSISGEHGDGLSRTPFVKQQYGELYPVMREVKRIFDPYNNLNPGKVIGDDPDLMTKNLRSAQPPIVIPAPAVEPAPTDVETGVNGEAAAVEKQLFELQLNWSMDELSNAARSCNGCGACRSQAPGTRMCPIFRFAPSEESSPRAKANLMRGILSGQLDPQLVHDDEFKSVADLCVNCQMCRLECPAGVDIPKLMLEAKAEYVATNGMPWSSWVLSRLDLLGSLGSLFSPVANWAISNRPARWVIEKLLGIAQGRKLPRFAPRTFMRRANRRQLTQPTRRTGRKVVYFVDTYANYHDPQLAEALVAVLEHNGVSVYVHPDQEQSGMAMISMGAAERARRVAEKNVEILAEAVRQGYTIVASEPTAALALTREYPALLEDDDAQLVAQNTSEACTYLWNLHLTGKLLLDLRPVNATLGYHQPCHLKALEVGSPGESLLRLIPGLNVQRTEKGCSGMAGTFGLKRENYRSSLRAGWPLISALRESRWQAGSTECSACKMQMEQGTNKPTIHPLKLLALAYGLMPEVASLLTKRGQELIVS